MFRKKLTIISLCLLLALPHATHAATRLISMAAGNSYFGNMSLAATERGIYMLTGNSLELFPVSNHRIGSAEFAGMMPKENMLIASWKNKLYGIDLQENQLHMYLLTLPEEPDSITLTEISAPLACGDALNLGEDEHLAFILDFVMVGDDQAALLLTDIENKTWTVWTDFSKGICQPLPVRHGIELAAASDGTLYIMTSENEVRKAEPKTGTTALVFQLDEKAAWLPVKYPENSTQLGSPA